MIVTKLRQGIGFDIEHNEDILHIVGFNEEEQFIAAFVGTIIKLPFISVYIGSFEPVDGWEEDKEE